MSDSSEDEDLSKFEAALDTTFLKLIKDNIDSTPTTELPKSDRYLETSAHYNDVKVPKAMQNRIGAEVSKIIERNFKFVDLPQTKIRKAKLKGGVRLFRTSSDFLSCEDVKDTETELHNVRNKKRKPKKRTLDDEIAVDENEKLQASIIGGEYVMSKEETLNWKSRRKEKLYKYKSVNNTKLLTAIE